jgi:predicted neuraminidase
MFIFDKAAFASCHASTLVELNSPGRLMAAWFGGTSEGAKDVKIWSALFDGEKWTKPAVLAEEPGFPCWNPVLFTSATATLFLFYKAGPNPASWTGYVRRSNDIGKTWSPAAPLTAGLLGPIKNKPIQLRSGAILAPTSVESHRAWACWVERSEDDCETWQRFGPIQAPGHPYGVIQPTLFEVAPNDIVLACRSRGIGFVCQARSKDGGRTWTDAKPSALPNPNSGVDGVRGSDGSLYLVYNHTGMGRSPLNIARSTDQGESWAKVATLEDQPGEYSYPAVIQGGDGKLHITYTWNRRHIKYVTADPAKLS